MITILRAAPLLTVQDRGRAGYLASGITGSGPLDPLALTVANALAGNHARAAALEACLGGAEFRFARATTFAMTGAAIDASLDGARVEAYVTHHASGGAVLTVGNVRRGAVWYLAVRGGADAPMVLGSRSTLLSAGIGAPLKRGDGIGIGEDMAAEPPRAAVPAELRSALDDAPIPLCPGPREDALTAEDWDAFGRATFAVSHAISRVGYRLDGHVLPTRLSAALASEAACAGAMQLPPEGRPIVLMADHPTVGGYPIIGVVPSHARGMLAQRAPGTAVRFIRTPVEHAVAARRHERDALSKWAASE